MADTWEDYTWVDEAWDSIKGDRPKFKTQELGTPEQQALRADFLTKLLNDSGYTASTGNEFTAPASMYEQTGLESLQKYLAQADPEHYGDINNAMTTALSGDSPYTVDREATSDYLRDAIMPGLRRDYGKMRTDLQESFAGGGKYWATPRLEAEENLSEEYLRNAGETVAGYKYKDVESERAGKVKGAEIAAGTLPHATAISDYLTGGDLRKTAASQQYGALPRLLEQNTLTSQFQDWTNTQNNILKALGMDTTQSYWTPDTGYIRELIAGVSQAAGAAAGAAGAA